MYCTGLTGWNIYLILVHARQIPAETQTYLPTLPLLQEQHSYGFHTNTENTELSNSSSLKKSTGIWMKKKKSQTFDKWNLNRKWKNHLKTCIKTFLPQSHAVRINIGCGLVIPYGRMQGSPWRSCPCHRHSCIPIPSERQALEQMVHPIFTGCKPHTVE